MGMDERVILSARLGTVHRSRTEIAPDHLVRGHIDILQPIDMMVMAQNQIIR